MPELDADDIGINISTDWSVGDTITGILKVFLIHEPISQTGNSRDDFGGGTDIEVDFKVIIQ